MSGLKETQRTMLGCLVVLPYQHVSRLASYSHLGHGCEVIMIGGQDRSRRLSCEFRIGDNEAGGGHRWVVPDLRVSNLTTRCGVTSSVANGGNRRK